MSGRSKHIVLIGFMGSGKSHIGKLLSSSLNLPFFDLDEEIVKVANAPISKIFEEKGEHYFRKLEQKMVLKYLNFKEPIILSTGGGTPCFFDNMDHILQNSFSFYLKVSRKNIFNRIHGDTNRPLVASKTKSELKQFIEVSLKAREDYYLKANQIIRAFDRPESIVKRMVRYLDKNDI